MSYNSNHGANRTGQFGNRARKGLSGPLAPAATASALQRMPGWRAGGAFLQRAPPSTVVPTHLNQPPRGLVGGHQSTAEALQARPGGWAGVAAWGGPPARCHVIAVQADSQRMDCAKALQAASACSVLQQPPSLLRFLASQASPDFVRSRITTMRLALPLLAALLLAGAAGATRQPAS